MISFHLSLYNKIHYDTLWQLTNSCRNFTVESLPSAIFWLFLHAYISYIHFCRFFFTTYFRHFPFLSCLANSDVLKYTEMIKWETVIEWTLPGCQTPMRVFLHIHMHKLCMDHITFHPNWANFVREGEQQQIKITLSKLRGIVIQHLWLWC